MRCGLEYLEEGIQLLSPIHVRWKKLVSSRGTNYFSKSGETHFSLNLEALKILKEKQVKHLVEVKRELDL